MLARHSALYPAAMRTFSDDLPASLTHLELPLAHRKHVRTTDLIERSLEEERHRTKILPWFRSEHSGLKLICIRSWVPSRTSLPNHSAASWPRVDAVPVSSP